MTILNKEQEVELKDNRRNGRALREMTQTEGWSEIIVPGLNARKESLSRKLANASELKDFIKYQQAINAIDNLFNFIDSSIVLGDQAAEALESHKDNQRKEIVNNH